MTSITLPRIINAAGHLSMLGGGVTRADLAKAIASAIEQGLANPVDMAWLKDEVSRRIAAHTGAEAGCVTTGAAAGIALSVAACVTGDSLDAVRQLPDAAHKPIVLQSGHDIDFGAPVVQMVRMGGGAPVVAGSPSKILPGDLHRSLEWASALLFVLSHHVVARERLPLSVCIEAAHAAGKPVIVDAAAEEDLRGYIAAGADLVIYSGGKALGGLSSSGFVAGRAELVRAVRAQERGIGRAMKVGPEQLLSVAVALDAYAPGGGSDSEVLETLRAALGGIEAVELAIVDDEAGRAIQRLEVRTPRAGEAVAALRGGTPPIYVRAHHASEGRFAIDPRNLTVETAREVAAAVRAALGG